jgi:hypothetical protein
VRDVPFSGHDADIPFPPLAPPFPAAPSPSSSLPHSLLLAARMSRLASLDLSGSKRADPCSVSAFVAAHGPSLRRLALDGVVTLTDAHLVATILPACPNLTHLSLAHCPGLTDDTLRALAASPCARTLVSLRLTGCTGLTGEGVKAVLVAGAEGATAGQARMRNLELREVRGLTDVTLESIVTHCPRLGALDCSSGDPFAGGAAPIATVSSANNAGPLDPTAITDAGVSALLLALPDLRTLRVGGHAGVGDGSLASFVHLAPSLETLDVRGCKGVGDATLVAVAAACPRVRELRLFGCGSVTDAGLAALASLRSLETLDVFGCRNLTAEGLRRLVEALAGGQDEAAAQDEALTNSDFHSSSSSSSTARGGRLSTVHMGGAPALRPLILGGKTNVAGSKLGGFGFGAAREAVVCGVTLKM